MNRKPIPIIRINDLDLTEHFLSKSREEQKIQIIEIIEKGFNSNNFGVISIEKKAKAVTELFSRSIKVLEEEEKYEECVILQLVIETIPEVVNKLTVGTT